METISSDQEELTFKRLFDENEGEKSLEAED